MEMNKRLKRVLVIFGVGVLFIASASFSYFYFRSYLVFFIIVILSFVISYLMPLWFRLFLKTHSYTGKYKEPLLSYAKKHNVRLRNIFAMKSKRSNACAFSFLNNKTVCYNINTLDNHPWDEIEGVMAHELGHHANYDIYFYTATVALILILSSLVNVTFYSFLPQNLLYLLLISIITSTLLLPIVLAISRWREGMADTYAKRILDEPAKLARFLERMLIYEEKAGEKVSKNLTFVHAVFLTHPWVYNRIRYLKG